MNAHSQTGFDFLSVVPLEIRNLIYYHVFFDRYYYKAQPNPSIGLLGTSRALRDEATHTLYSQSKFQIGYIDKTGMDEQSASHLHVGNCQPDSEPPTGLRRQELGPSQAIIERLDHVEIHIDMDDYSFEPYQGAIRNVTNFHKDLFRKLGSVDRVRKTCRIVIRNTGFSCRPWLEYPFSPDLRRLSTFKTISIEIECEAIDFEDFETVDRGPIELPFDAEDDFRGSELHVRMISLKELTTEKLRTCLEKSLGKGMHYTRRNLRCLTFHPQSTQA